MTTRQSYKLLQLALAEVESELSNPKRSSIEEGLRRRSQKAGLLTQLGRFEEAKSVYLEILFQNPTYLDALIDFGNLLLMTGFRTAAKTLYTQAVASHPDNPMAHANLANLLFVQNEMDTARKEYEITLKLDPDNFTAHQGLAYIYTASRDERRAVSHRRKGFQSRPVVTLPYYGDAPPIKVLLISSVMGGMIRILHHLDPFVFEATELFVEVWDMSHLLPDHHIVFNAVADADLCREGLRKSISLLENTTVRIFNHPRKIISTGRMDMHDRLSGIPGVIAPQIALFSRPELMNPRIAAILEEKGFCFPLLIRPPGFHTGLFFNRVEDEKSLRENLSAMPSDEFFVIQYIDCQSPDGKVRKYRVMSIDGKLFPLHAAISREWKIHYFTAEMADNPLHRSEDESFINNMPAVLGSKVIQNLKRIGEVLDLDYAGIDFSIDRHGNLVVFEANASMVVNPVDPDERWTYRQSPVRKIMEAIRTMLLEGGNS